MPYRDPYRDGIVASDGRRWGKDRRSRPQLRQLVAKDGVITCIGDGEAQQNDPAEMAEHVPRVPAPGPGHHQYRRRGIMGKHAAHRDVGEQQPKVAWAKRGDGFNA